MMYESGAGMPIDHAAARQWFAKSAQAGVAMARWAWGAPFADINNDGWEDLLVANGFITQPNDPGDL